MPLPNSFAKKRRTVALAPLVQGGITASSSSTIIDYVNHAQYQILSNWCWAASGAAICDFFLGSTAGKYRYQCENASEFISGASKCCDVGKPFLKNGTKALARMKDQKNPLHFDLKVACNTGGRAYRVIDGCGKLTSDYDDYSGDGPNATELAKIVASIKARRPFVRRLKWDKGGGHATVVYGYGISTGSKPWFSVADPWDGIQIEYKSTPRGRWRGSCFVTKK